MLNRYFSPFVIVNRVEERIIARGDIEGTIFSKKEKDYSPSKDRSIKIWSTIVIYIVNILKNTRISIIIYYEYFTRNVESKSTLCLLFIRTKSYPRIFDAWITIDGINGKIDDRWLALNENVKGRFASPRPRVRFKSLSLSLSSIEISSGSTTRRRCVSPRNRSMINDLIFLATVTTDI